MPEQLTAREIATWRTFLTAHATAVARIQVDLEDGDLVPLEWYDVLVAIQQAPDNRLRMMNVAQNLLLTRSNATRLIDRLETVGLIRRGRLDQDRRGTAAILTPSGREALRRAWPVYARGIKRYFLSRLSTGEKQMLASALARVAEQPRPPRPASRRRKPTPA